MSTLAIGDFFGPYQLIEEIGVGGVAHVIRARHIHPAYTDTTFALKLLHEDLCKDEAIVELFRREAYVLSLMKHPYLVKTFEAGLQDNRLFIAMEYIDGRDLEVLLARCAELKIALPIPLLLHIIAHVLEGLSYAHTLEDTTGAPLHLIHRDVNPANIFISYAGDIKLGDFGVASIAGAHLTKNRQLAGKIGYFAPEQLSVDTTVDHRADLFAVGVMLFEMLCGCRLFESDDPDVAMRLNKRAKIPKPSHLNPAIDASLEKLILKALESKPAARFATAEAMLHALQPFLPDPRMMPLAISSIMRQIFWREYSKEIELRAGLAGIVLQDKNMDVRIGLIAQDESVQSAFTSLLQMNHYVVCHTEVLQNNPPTPVVLVCLFDTTMPIQYADPDQVVVAIVQNLEPNALQRAYLWGANAILFRPYVKERVLSVLRAACISLQMPVSLAKPEVVVHARLMLLGHDVRRADYLKQKLREYGYIVDYYKTLEEALQSTYTISYNCIIYIHEKNAPLDKAFVQAYRNMVGMALVPMICLLDDAQEDRPAAERIDIHTRDATLQQIMMSLQRFSNNQEGVRAFVRYPIGVPVDLRYGGRIFTCTSIDISRGGIMLTCSHMLPVGTHVALKLALPEQPPIQALGIIKFVQLVSNNHDDTTKLGISFYSFAGRAETLLITYLNLLHLS